MVYSNMVFCAAPVGAGSAAVQVTFANGTWSANNQLWSSSDTYYQMQWTTPVRYQTSIYGIFGDCRFIGSGDPARLWCVDMATGYQRWSQPYFGMGGTILVNNYLLALTEDGQLVLIQPDPAAYKELARFQVFQFSSATPGKCWISPAYSNGRIYARSTTGGVCVDVSAAVIGPLAQIQVTPTNATVAQYGRQQFTATALDALGTPLSPQPAFTWSVSGGGTLDTNGLFTAYGVPGGPFVVMANAGGISNSTALNIISNGLPFLPAQTARVIHELTLLTVTNTATAGPFVMQSQLGTNTSTFNYTNREALLADGWSFLAKLPSGTNRNTEITNSANGAVVSYDQTNHPGVLRIPCDSGDLWGSANNSRNSLFRNLPANWLSVQLRLSFAPAPTASYQQVHLGLYQDDDNYLEVGSSYNSGLGMSMTLETSGSPNTLTGFSASGTLFYFQLNRNPVNSAITGLGSVDGINWTAMGPSSQPFANPRLIIWTGNGTQSPYVSGSPNCDLSNLTFITSNSVPVPRTLSYRLVNPPAGASIDTNGVITWRPALGQAISTNLIMTVVTDNGTPPMTVTNTFSVVVLPQPPQLKLFPPQLLSSTQLQLRLGTTNGTPIDSNRLTGIEVRATNRLGGSPLSWPKLTNPLVLTTNGLVLLTNWISATQTQLFFITIEPP
jgi:hypothetical protein